MIDHTTSGSGRDLSVDSTASVDNGVLTIAPESNFVGICDVTIRVDDGIPVHFTSDDFQVNITDPKYAILLNLYFMITP